MAKKDKLTNKKRSTQENSLIDERIFILEKKRDQLSYLCQNLDPFSPSISEEYKKLLKDFHLDNVDDPYRLTALLITLMEDTITELQTLSGSSISDLNPSIPSALNLKN